MDTFSRNRLLSSLSPGSRDALLAKSSQVELPVRTPLYEPEKRPSHIYFMTSGICSTVTPIKDGSTAEVALVGREGVVGSIFLLGSARVSTRSFVQLAGTAVKVPLSEANRAFRTVEEVRDRILEFTQEQVLSASQIAGCNRLHEAEERLARWLLMAQDRTQSDVLELTQEFLAMMLGTRRTTVTLIAGYLQKAGLIEYSRGRVRILSRENLEAAACDCYRIMKGLYEGLYERRPASLDAGRSSGSPQPA